jgi:HK97 family phage major capsid protein
MKNQIILEAIKTALTDKNGNEVKVNLKEASALTGSGSGVGGRVIYDDAFASLRMANPLRVSSREITTIGSDQAFVVKTGNATNPTNPWGYPVNVNTGTPNIATSFWQLPLQAITAQLPVRTAVMSDINNLDPAIVGDLLLEFSQQEALSMILNNDQAGSTTTSTGATSGLRGLNYYPSGSSAAFGTSGSGATAGLHTVKTVSTATGGAIGYNDIAALASALPAQYWSLPGTSWHMHPSTILALRELVSSSGQPLFVEVGDSDGGAVAHVFGFPVVPNPYMQTVASGAFPVYLANWDKFLTIVDHEEFSIQRLEQTQPGTVTLYAEKRVCSTIRDVFAGVRLES